MAQLGFGLNPLPPGVETAWGARAIITQDGHVDIVHDRTDAVGPDEQRHTLLHYLTTNVKTQPWKELQRLLSSGELSTREDKRVTLYEDDTVIVEGNPNASAGYCYMVAYFKADRTEEGHMAEPDGETRVFNVGVTVVALVRGTDEADAQRRLGEHLGRAGVDVYGGESTVWAFESEPVPEEHVLDPGAFDVRKRNT